MLAYQKCTVSSLKSSLRQASRRSAWKFLTTKKKTCGFLSYHLTLKMLVKRKQNTLVLSCISAPKPRRGERKSSWLASGYQTPTIRDSFKSLLQKLLAWNQMVHMWPTTIQTCAGPRSRVASVSSLLTAKDLSWWLLCFRCLPICR